MRIYHQETAVAALRDGPNPPEVDVHATGIDALLTLPVSLGGEPRSDSTNPEQLFGAALSGCMVLAVEHTLRRLHRRPADLTGLSVRADVRIGRAADRTNRLEVDLLVELPALDQARAEAVCDEALRYCPFHQAIVGNVAETITVVGGRPSEEPGPTA